MPTPDDTLAAIDDCLCGATHRAQVGICEHDAVDTIVRVSPTVGRVQIPVCGPCRDAQMAEARCG